MTNAPWREIGNALHLALLRSGNRAVLGSTALIVAVVAHVTLEAWLSWHALIAPREFYWPHAMVILGGFALLCLSGWLAAGALGRPALSWTLAGYSALALFPLRLVLSLTLTEPPETVVDWVTRLFEPAALNPVARQDSLWLLLAAFYGLLVLRQMGRWLARDGQRRHRWMATACLSSGLLIGFDASRYSTFWYPPWDAETASNFDAEAVMYAQAELMHHALTTLAPQTPGKQDVYVLAFGGDGAEDVFRNEVELATKQFNQVFDSSGRTVALINHPDRVLTTPLATRTNLSIALQWLGRWMDPTEDLLILFMTSHGSEDPSIHVAMDPLPLNPITPSDLQQMLDESAIRWKIAIISACYSRRISAQPAVARKPCHHRIPGGPDLVRLRQRCRLHLFRPRVPHGRLRALSGLAIDLRRRARKHPPTRARRRTGSVGTTVFVGHRIKTRLPSPQTRQASATD